MSVLGAHQSELSMFTSTRPKDLGTPHSNLETSEPPHFCRDYLLFFEHFKARSNVFFKPIPGRIDFSAIVSQLRFTCLKLFGKRTD
jgi:hypothetical protein